MEIIPIADKKKEKALTTSTNLNDLVRFSFMVVYTILLTTGTITFIEALRTDIPEVRHVMNLETCISIVAGYYYSIFITKTGGATPIDWGEITKLRYIDWSITTPLMLITLCIVLAKNAKKTITFRTMFSIIGLNYLMLAIGYYGVINPQIKLIAMIGGFIPFFVMFYIIYVNFYDHSVANKVLFIAFSVVWSMYGLVYMLQEQYKNISMNILDLIAKCFIGLGLWVYYTKIITKY